MRNTEFSHRASAFLFYELPYYQAVQHSHEINSQIRNLILTKITFPQTVLGDLSEKRVQNLTSKMNTVLVGS